MSENYKRTKEESERSDDDIDEIENYKYSNKNNYSYYENNTGYYNTQQYNAHPSYYGYTPSYPTYNSEYSGMSSYIRKNPSVLADSPTNSKSTGKKKVNLKYIESKSKRGVTFSKRKKGIMKKAFELNVLTGTQILLLVASESGHVYTFATPKLKPIVTEHEHLIQQCLNMPSFKNDEDYNDYYENGSYRRPNGFYGGRK